MPWLDNRYGHMVNEYCVARVREVFAQRSRQRERIRTRRDALKLRDRLQRDFLEIFGPWPAKTPLNPRITGRISIPGCTVEKIIIESRPSFLVSANLYIPDNLTDRAPAVLGTCGHSEDGKAEPNYQSFAQGLALKGFVVLIYDPISQGERVQYPGLNNRCAIGLCAEHNMLGSQLALAGDWFGSWRAWDGIRCLDYLLSRPEVDPRRVGVTGNSGGGTLTGWLSAVDSRFTMSAPGCWVTSVLHNTENELPVDVEQVPPGFLDRGLDHVDCFLAHAPRPVILLSQSRDFFDQRGTHEAYRQLKRIYGLLGAAENVKLMIGPNPHGFSVHLREAMYGFFCRHAGLKRTAREPRLRLQPPTRLRASADGSVARAGSRLVVDFSHDMAAQLKKTRKAIPAARLPAELCRLLAMPDRAGVPHHRILRRSTDQETWQGYAIETEPGIQAIVTMVDTKKQDHFAVPREKRCTLLVPHLGAAQDLRNLPLRRLLDGGGRLFAVDPRGIGQSMPRGCDGSDFFSWYDCDFHFHSMGIMLGESYAGRRVFDVLRTIDWLRASGYTDIRLAGRGLGSLTALFAAVLEPRLTRVTLINTLRSYHELMQPTVHKWPASAQVPGILKTLDLPDLHRALGRRLRMVDAWNAQMQTG